MQVATAFVTAVGGDHHGGQRLGEMLTQSLHHLATGDAMVEVKIGQNQIRRAPLQYVHGFGLINRRHTLDEIALPQMAERFAQLAEAPGAPLPRPLPALHLASDAQQQAETLAALKITRPEKFAVFCPGAEYGPAKRWPAKHFASLAETLSQRGYQIWLLGSAKDRAIAEAIIAQATSAPPGSLLNLCGTTSLAQAIDLIAAAAFVVCNDSGLMHVAAALGRPLIAVYGSSSPGFTPPLSEQAQVISLGLACSPCFKRDCPLGHLDCLNQLIPDRVLAACPPSVNEETS